MISHFAHGFPIPGAKLSCQIRIVCRAESGMGRIHQAGEGVFPVGDDRGGNGKARGFRGSLNGVQDFRGLIRIFVEIEKKRMNMEILHDASGTLRDGTYAEKGSGFLFRFHPGEKILRALLRGKAPILIRIEGAAAVQILKEQSVRFQYRSDALNI